jgi:hypothetical protein
MQHEPCERCQGSGQYRYVSKATGKPAGGECYRCGGKGWQDESDRRRNAAYDRHAIVEAFRAMVG